MVVREWKLAPWPPEDCGEFLNFKLILRGYLPPNKRGVAGVKQRIRRELHPQLKFLWQSELNLKDAFKPHSSPLTETGVDRLANQYQRCGYRFAPLIRKDKNACKLHIQILRRDDPFKVFSGAGDLDGRVKTLIDGLRMPGQCGEVDGQSPSDDEDPFFCLLEDDRSIYEFSVETDRLLLPPEPHESEQDVVAVIEVTVTTILGRVIAGMPGAFY